jgi:hypothetical protein
MIGAVSPCGRERDVSSPKGALGAVLAAGVVALAAGCGGSSTPSAVNGCEIQPATSCPNGDFSDADLGGVDLSQADLSGANLTDTNLSGANLTETNLSDAQLVNTDLSDSDLTRANLTAATITGANLDGATLCGTTRTDGTTDDSSCPASTESTTMTTSTTETATSAEATVTSFEVGALDCGSGASAAAVQVSWQTQAATAVKLEVDDQTPSNSAQGLSGSTDLQVPCDSATHKVTVIALSDAGEGQSVSKDVGPS